MATIKTLTQFDFYNEIEKCSGLSLVYFSAVACASCKHLSHILQQLPAKDCTFDIFKVDAQQDQALVSEYEVFHLPSLFLFKAGQFHSELQCEASISSIKQAIEQASVTPAKEAP